MRIESGTTGERRTRILIFLVLCIVFASWFGYDGLIGYPAKNRKWAGQAMPEKPEDLTTNSLAVLKNLYQIRKGMTVEEVTRMVGRPALVQPRWLIFTGPERMAVVRMENGKVVGLTTNPIDPKDKVDQPNQYVTQARAELIKKGMDEAEVKEQFRQNDPREEKKTLWFVGPAAYAKVKVDEGRVVDDSLFNLPTVFTWDLNSPAIQWPLREEFANHGLRLSQKTAVSTEQPGSRWLISDGGWRCTVTKEGARLVVRTTTEVHENQQHTEGDIRLQKTIAVALLVLGVIVALKLLLVMRSRVVLDDSGLAINRKHIAWDAITGLNTGDYAEKGRLDLQYKQGDVTRRVRLDAYHIHLFDEIVNAICQRKGYPSPVKPKVDDKPHGSSVDAP